MNNEHIYQVDLKWNDTKKGTMSSPVLEQTIEVATPPEFPGGIEGVWSPEHLFVASVNSCIMTTFLAIAENSRLKFSDFRSEAVGVLEKVDGKFAISRVTVTPRLAIKDENDREKAERVLQKAEAACLISNSIKTEIIFNPEVTSGEFAY